MTINELRIMAGGGRCRIKDASGKYLAFRGREPIFVDDAQQGVVYHYVSDNVAGQIAFVTGRFHQTWEAVPEKE